MRIPFEPHADIWRNPDRLAPALHATGRELTGRNLGLGAWREIARAIVNLGGPSTAAGAALTRRLAAASTRADVSWVLNRVRRLRDRNRKRRARVPQPSRSQTSLSAVVFEAHDHVGIGAIGESGSGWHVPDALREELGRERLPHIRCGLPPGLRLRPWTPVGHVVRAELHRIDRYLGTGGGRPGSLGYQLAADVADGPGERGLVHLSIRHALGANAADRMILALEGGADQLVPLDQPADLALAHLLRVKHRLRVLPACEWDSLHERLEEVLRRPPSRDVRLVAAVAHALLSMAPWPVRHRFLRELPSWDNRWLPLAVLALPELLEASRAQRRPRKGPAIGPRAGLRGVSADELAAAAGYSRLSAVVIAHAVTDIVSEEGAWPSGKLPPDPRWWYGAGALLRGAGSIRSHGYPAFRAWLPMGRARPQRTQLDHEIVSTALLLESTVREFREDPVEAAVAAILAEADPVPSTRPTLARILRRTIAGHVDAYCRLRAAAGGPGRSRLSRRHIRQVMSSQPPSRDEPAEPQLLMEATASALLAYLNHLWEGLTPPGRLKGPIIEALRSLALAYPDLADAPGERAAHEVVPMLRLLGGRAELLTPSVRDSLIDFIAQRLHEGVAQLQWALGIPHDERLPRSRRHDSLEAQARRLLRQLGRGRDRQVAPALAFEVRPLGRLEALHRGDLAGDCSSRSIPLRALDPHHVYYGLYLDGQPTEGYVGLHEAWAAVAGQSDRIPVLVLETINVPYLPGVEGNIDLVVLFQAVAAGRGLRLVLSLRDETWNYGNNQPLRTTRFWREGCRVVLSPADPVQWWLYDAATREAGYYTSLPRPTRGRHPRLGPAAPLPGASANGATEAVLLPPFDPELDRIHAANAAEASRIARRAATPLRVTARAKDGRPAGFITEWPR